MKTTVNVAVCFCIGYVALVNGVKTLPSYLQQCSRSDPKLNECALESAKAGLSYLVKAENLDNDEDLHGDLSDVKYRLLPLDPAKVERITFGDFSEKPVGMGFILNNCTIIGLGTTEFSKMRFDLKKLHVEVEGIIRKLIVLGRYNVRGKILVLPIKGDGNANFTVSDVKFIDKVDYELYKKSDNKEYFRVKNSKINSSLGNVIVNLTNLFNGDKALGNSMNLLLNQNWQEVEKISRPAIEEAIAGLIANLLNNLLKDIPYEDIFLP